MCNGRRATGAIKPRGGRKARLSQLGKACKGAPLLWQCPGQGVFVERPFDGCGDTIEIGMCNGRNATRAI
jgi:hypothetical protein